MEFQARERGLQLDTVAQNSVAWSTCAFFCWVMTSWETKGRQFVAKISKVEYQYVHILFSIKISTGEI